MNLETQFGMGLSHPAHELNDDLRWLLVQLFGKIIVSQSPSPITLTVFLCAIYVRYPKEIEKFFANPGKFDELTRKYDIRFDKSELVSAPMNVSRLIQKNRISIDASLPKEALGNTLGVDVSLEPMLANILRAAGKLAVNSGRTKA